MGMAEPARTPHPTLYDRDFTAWSQEQTRALRSKQPRSLDWDNLAEEIESLGGRERTEIRSRLRVLLAHLLEWQVQPERRSHSWQSTIGEQRIHIGSVIEHSPSLHGFPASIIETSYAAAVRSAALETGLPASAFPARLPYTPEQALDDTFLPGDPWSPSDLG